MPPRSAARDDHPSGARRRDRPPGPSDDGRNPCVHLRERHRLVFRRRDCGTSRAGPRHPSNDPRALRRDPRTGTACRRQTLLQTLPGTRNLAAVHPCCRRTLPGHDPMIAPGGPRAGRGRRAPAPTADRCHRTACRHGRMPACRGWRPRHCDRRNRPSGPTLRFRTGPSMRAVRPGCGLRCSSPGNHPQDGHHGARHEEHRGPPGPGCREDVHRNPACCRHCPARTAYGCRPTSSPRSDGPPAPTRPGFRGSRLPTGGVPRLVRRCAPAQPWQRDPLVRCRRRSAGGSLFCCRSYPSMEP